MEVLNATVSLLVVSMVDSDVGTGALRAAIESSQRESSSPRRS